MTRVAHDKPPRTLANGAMYWLKEHFRYISTTSDDKVHILLFNGCVKVHAKICARAEIPTKVAAVAFQTHPV